jgi:hypothetical protein
MEFKCLCGCPIFQPLMAVTEDWLPGGVLQLEGIGVKCAMCERLYDAKGVLIHAQRTLEKRMFTVDAAEIASNVDSSSFPRAASDEPRRG